MNQSGGNSKSRASGSFQEQDWLSKRNALLQSMAQLRKAQSRDPARLAQDRDRLTSDAERLESENHALASQVKDLEIELSRKRRMVQSAFRKADEAKRKSARLSSEERVLAGEIHFLEAEKARLQEQHAHVMKGLEANLASLDATVRQTGFVKGEMETLVDKMDHLERQVPHHGRDVNQFDEIIAEAFQAIKDLYERVKCMDRTTRTIYYRMKKAPGK